MAEKSTKTVPIDPTLHKKLKILSIEEERDLKEIVNVAVAEYLAKQNSRILKAI
jgi:predicted transcriptional regulator